MKSIVMKSITFRKKLSGFIAKETWQLCKRSLITSSFYHIKQQQRFRPQIVSRRMALYPSMLIATEGNSESSLASHDEIDRIRQQIIPVLHEGEDAALKLLKTWDFRGNPFPIIALWLRAADSIGFDISPFIPNIISSIRSTKYELLEDIDISNAFYSLRHINSHNPATASDLLGALVITVGSYSGTLEADCIIRCLAGLAGMTIEKKEAIQAVALFGMHLNNCMEKLTSNDIAHMVFGLHAMSDEDPEVRSILIDITRLMRTCIGGFGPDVALPILQALTSWNGAHSETAEFINVLTSKLSHCNVKLNSRDICELLHCVINLKCNASQLQGLVKVVGRQICEQQSKGLNMSQEEIVFVLSLLRQIEIDHVTGAVVLNMVSSILESNTSQPLPISTLAETLNILAAFEAFDISMRKFLASITPFLFSPREQPSTVEITALLFALNTLSDDIVEVRQYMRSLAALVTICEGTFSSTEIANSLYGFYSMSSLSQEQSLLFAALSKRFHQSNTAFSSKELATAFAGLRLIRAERPEARMILTSIYPLVLRCKNASTEDLDDALQSACLWNEQVPEVQNILLQLKKLYSHGK